MSNTVLQRYAPAILSFVVLVVGGLQAVVAAGPVTWVALAQLAVLVATSATTYFVPLIESQTWRGAAKTGLELVGVIFTLALPFIAAGAITPAELLLVAVAVVKALAAQLGVIIRTDPAPADPIPVVVDVKPGESARITPPWADGGDVSGPPWPLRDGGSTDDPSQRGR